MAELVRFAPTESNSSMKMMHGACSLAAAEIPSKMVRLEIF